MCLISSYWILTDIYTVCIKVNRTLSIGTFLLAPSICACRPAEIRDYARKHWKSAWFSQNSVKIIVAFYGNGIGNVQRFDPSHFDRPFELSEGVCAVTLCLTSWVTTKNCSDSNIARKSFKRPKSTKTSFTILLLVTKRGVSNTIRKQSVKVPNGGQKTSREPKSLVWEL